MQKLAQTRPSVALVQGARRVSAWQRAIRASSWHRAKSGSLGQGTIEYVALIALVAVVMVAVVSAAGGLKGDEIASSVVNEIKDAIGDVSKEGPNGGHKS